MTASQPGSPQLRAGRQFIKMFNHLHRAGSTHPTRLLAEAAADGKVSCAPTAVERTVGIQAAEARQVVHGSENNWAMPVSQDVEVRMKSVHSSTTIPYTMFNSLETPPGIIGPLFA